MLGQIMQPQAWQTANSEHFGDKRLLGHDHFKYACRRARADAGAVQFG